MGRIKYIKNNGVEERQIKPPRSFILYLCIVLIVIMILFFLYRILIDYSTTYDVNSLIVSLTILLFIISGWGYTALWYFFGKERLIFVADELHYKKDLLGFGIQRKYDFAKITNPKIISYWKRKIYNPFQFFENIYNYGIFTHSYGKILSFDYGGQTKYFGFNIEESEAEELLEKIEKYIERGYITP